ncbi:MAG TPA: hypothetical protein V6C85_01780 [Allocoleopsis sp.]
MNYEIPHCHLLAGDLNVHYLNYWQPNNSQERLKPIHNSHFIIQNLLETDWHCRGEEIDVR